MEKNEKIKQYAQELRKNATKEENLLWYKFLRHYPVQFRRQCPFDRYIVDFYCAKARLVVELDGSQHYDRDGMEHDRQRTGYLGTLGLEVLRFSNADVLQRFDDVCRMIDLAVKNRYCPGATPVGTGRRALENKYYTAVRSPHPPPPGAPSPQGEGIAAPPPKIGGNMSKIEFIVPTLFGLEGLAGDELRRMDMENVRVEDRRVFFTGDERALAKANICLRTGERVMIVLAQFTAKTFEELFQGVYHANCCSNPCCY